MTDEETSTREPTWTPVASTDPMTGELVTVPGWGRRVGGWQPFDELLAERSRDPLRNILRDRGGL